MDEIGKHRTPIVITTKGKLVAELVPLDEAARGVFGCMAGDREDR
jgi:antitoxin (DNA-binding transcriptional repressor) of toxin-antitoxin stability system